MRNAFLIGLAAGLASALLFASAAAGSLPWRALVFFLTPLPIYLAGLALGWRPALAGAGLATAVLAVLAAPLGAFGFLLSEAGPAVALTYLAGLYRDSGVLKGPVDVEWYPIGRIVMWAALIGAGLAVATMLLIGGDIEHVRDALKAAAATYITKDMPDGARGALDDLDVERIADLALAFTPAMSAMSWTGGHLFDLWLAARLLRAAGLLARPWPDLAATWLPLRLPALLAAALVGVSFAEGQARVVSAALAGALFFAYLLQGLAIVHHTTRGTPWRGFALSTLYAALVLLNAIVPVMIAMLGLAETVRPIRKFPVGPVPPAPPPAPRPPSA